MRPGGSAFAPAVLRGWGQRQNLVPGLALVALAAAGWAYVAYHTGSTSSMGCCAGLMASLVALGMMNLAWTLTAAVVIFAEKTIPGSHRLPRPLGVLLIIGGAALLAAALLGAAASPVKPM